MMRAKLCIIATSARRLAQAARAAGYLVYAVDGFGDLDTQAASEELLIEPTLASNQPDAAKAEEAINTLMRRYGAMPVVIGGGLECVPRLVANIATTWQLLGNSPGVLEAVTDVARLQHFCRLEGIQHPDCDTNGTVRVRKPRATSGGRTIRFATHDVDEARRLTRPYHSGRSLSCVFLAHRGGAEIVGCCEHLNLQPTASAFFRHAGALGPVSLPLKSSRELGRIGRELGRFFGLQGMYGIDFICGTDGRPYLLEVNPRPTASIELLACPATVLAAHIAACTGSANRPRLQRRHDCRAYAIYYAPQPICIAHDFQWPDWCADRPADGQQIALHEPLCTVYAVASELPAARCLLEQRTKTLAARLGCEHVASRSDDLSGPDSIPVQNSFTNAIAIQGVIPA